MTSPTPKTAPEHAERHGIVQSTFDTFVDGTRAVVDLMGAAGSTAIGVLPDPVPARVTGMLASLREVAEQMPAIGAELDVLIHEVHAKRLSIQALRAELTALDAQLEVLEGSLAPVQAWSHQWSRLSSRLTETLPKAPA
jgi:hypothetical protein